MCNAPAEGTTSMKPRTAPSLASTITKRSPTTKVRQAQQPGHIGRNSGTRVTLGKSIEPTV